MDERMKEIMDAINIYNLASELEYDIAEGAFINNLDMDALEDAKRLASEIINGP